MGEKVFGPFKRLNKFDFDIDSTFDSYDAALKYAQDPLSTAYFGQRIFVKSEMTLTDKTGDGVAITETGKFGDVYTIKKKYKYDEVTGEIVTDENGEYVFEWYLDKLVTVDNFIWALDESKDVLTDLVSKKIIITQDMLFAGLSEKINKAYLAIHEHINKESLDKITVDDITTLQRFTTQSFENADVARLKSITDTHLTNASAYDTRSQAMMKVLLGKKADSSIERTEFTADDIDHLRLYTGANREAYLSKLNLLVEKDLNENDICSLQLISRQYSQGKTLATEDYVTTAVTAEAEAARAAEKALQDAIDTINIPVIGTADDEKVISITDKKLVSTLYINKTKKKDGKTYVQLIGKEGAVISEFDADGFVADGMLESVTKDTETNEIVFKWNTTAGISETRVDIDDLVEVYTAGNGIDITNFVVSVKKDAASESFLTVGVDGIKLSGVQAAIDTAKQEILDYVNEADKDWMQEDETQPDYIKNRPSIRAGQGSNSIVEGNLTEALGENSHAEGMGNIAGCRGFNILAIDPVGYDSTETAPTEMHLTLDSVEGLAVEDSCSVAINKNYMEMGKITNISENTITINAYPDDLTAAIISKTVVGGGDKLAYVFVSTKQNIGTTIFGSAQHAEGYETAALMIAAHAEGAATVASGKYSHAEGDSTLAGYAAHAEGQRTKALGGVSHAEGSNTTASGVSSHAEGQLSTASGSHSHAEGYDTDALGNRAHSEGYKTTAQGTDSHSEGNATKAIGDRSHAEGQESKASGWTAHAEGYKTEATKNKAHAEGGNTIASGETAHVEGHFTIASGYASHAEGYHGIAHGVGSHKEGLSTKIVTTDIHQDITLDPKITIIPSEVSINKDVLLSFWNGTYDGDADIISVMNSLKRNFQIAYGAGSHAEGCDTLALGSYSHVEGTRNIAYGDSSHVEGSSFVDSKGITRYNIARGLASHVEGGGNEASGNYSHAEGQHTQASGQGSHVEGIDTVASAEGSHAEGNSTAASGKYAHSEGISTIANGRSSHAEGEKAKAYAPYSHAEGRECVAGTFGQVNDPNNTDDPLKAVASEGAHAEGRYSKATGQAAHAEGNNTVAEGAHSHTEGTDSHATASRAHAEGHGTIASGDSQHAQGKYNVQDSSKAHIIGAGRKYKDENGEWVEERKNIHTVDWSGNAWFAGEVTSGEEKIALVKQTQLTEVNNKINNISSSISDISAQVSNIEAKINGGLYNFTTDSESKYIKEIPEKAMPYASLDILGGRVEPKTITSQVPLEFDFNSKYMDICDDQGVVRFRLRNNRDDTYLLISQAETFGFNQLKYYKLYTTKYLTLEREILSASGVTIKKYSKNDNNEYYADDISGTFARNELVDGEYFDLTTTKFYCRDYDAEEKYTEVYIGNYIIENDVPRKISLELSRFGEKVYKHVCKPINDSDATTDDIQTPYYGYYRPLTDNSGNNLRIEFCKETEDSEYFYAAYDEIVDKDLKLKGYIIIGSMIYSCRDYHTFVERITIKDGEEKRCIIQNTSKDTISGERSNYSETIRVSYGLGDLVGHSKSIDIPVKPGFNLANTDQTTFYMDFKLSSLLAGSCDISNLEVWLKTKNDTEGKIYDSESSRDVVITDDLRGEATHISLRNACEHYSLSGIGSDPDPCENRIMRFSTSSTSGSKITFGDDPSKYAPFTVPNYTNIQRIYDPVKVTGVLLGEYIDKEISDNLIINSADFNPDENHYCAACKDCVSSDSKVTYNAETKHLTITSDPDASCMCGQEQHWYDYNFTANSKTTIVANKLYTLRVKYVSGTFQSYITQPKIYLSMGVVGNFCEITIPDGASPGDTFEATFMSETQYVDKYLSLNASGAVFDNFTCIVEFGSSFKPVIGNADRIEIPEEVQNLPDYGVGISEYCYNYINFESLTYVHKCTFREDTGTVQLLETPEIIDVSQYFTNGDINISNKQAIIFENASAEPVASTVTYQVLL